jgi:integrase
MNIKLILRNINKKTSIGTVCVYLDFYFRNKREQKFFKTPVKISRFDWAGSEQVRKSNPNHKELNELLSFEKKRILDMINEMRRDEIEVTPQSISTIIEKKKEAKKDLIQLSDEYINSRVDLTERHRQKLKSLTSRIIDFSKGSKVYYSSINQKWIDSFTMYLQDGNPESENKNLQKSQQPSTINKTFSFFRQILNHLNSEGIIDDRYKSLKYPKGFQSKKVILTEEEIRKFIDFKPTSKKLQKVKDLSLIQLMTGLRYSDLINIRKTNISGNCLEIMNKKTKKYTSIPIHKELNTLLKKYDYNLSPLSLSNVNYNKYLKELMELVKVDILVEKFYFENGNMKSVFKPKYELIGTHTFRRTFITQSILKGIPIHVIQSITGHATLKQISEYVNIEEEMKAVEVKKLDSLFKPTD